MNLRSAISTILDSAYDFKSINVEVKLPSGEHVKAQLTYDACQEIVRVLANRLVRAEESARNEKTALKSRKIRVAIAEEFNLKTD